MKLAYVDLCGFRGYRKQIRIEFADGFTIIEGRNGVGKSTIFDAVEFALTGTLSKYDGAKADRESVSDYLWWTGRGPHPQDRYVEVGFVSDGQITKVRRTQFGKPDVASMTELSEQLCDMAMAPDDPLSRLCSRAIIRDEQIASLSLDLKEVERYALLRDGLGANDADVWTARGQSLVATTKRRSLLAQQDVARLNTEVAHAARRIDEVWQSLVADSVIEEATQRLRDITASAAPPDQLPGLVRELIVEAEMQVQSAERLLASWAPVEGERGRLPSLRDRVVLADKALFEAQGALEALDASDVEGSSSDLAGKARDLIALVEIGRRLNLQDGHCPLCASGVDGDRYERGIQLAESLARKLDEQAVLVAQRESSRRAAAESVSKALAEKALAEGLLASSELAVRHFDRLREESGLTISDTADDVEVRLNQMRSRLDLMQKDLRVLATLRLSGELERVQREEAQAKERLAAAQERAGLARRAEVSAQSLFDSARRASSETLDRRLERVLPLMSELYRRLRPHPIWRDIEYSIRGDVRKFLKLQVGENLNPQFLFSSGQRRATGLAFLLSVNLSLAWSRLKSIMLDDPVQHVDDFRTIHLAELAAQLVREGRQIICSVEDAALADLLSRRLPVREYGSGKRVSLGPDIGGDLSVIEERTMSPMSRDILAPGHGLASTG